MLKELGVGALTGVSGGFVTGMTLYYIGSTVHSVVSSAPSGAAGFVIGFAGTVTAGLAWGADKVFNN